MAKKTGAGLALHQTGTGLRDGNPMGDPLNLTEVVEKGSVAIRKK